MQRITVLALFVALVFGDPTTLKQLSNEVLQIAAHHSYDAILVSLEGPVMDAFSSNPRVSATIYQSTCPSVGRKRCLCIIEFPKNSSEISCLLSFCSRGIMLLIHRNSSTVPQFINDSNALLRKAKISKAITVIYDPVSPHLINWVPYDYFRRNIQPVSSTAAILELFNPITKENLQGYRYNIGFKRLYPYFYWNVINGRLKLLGLDYQVLEIVVAHQNATLNFQDVSLMEGSCPPVHPLIDLSIRRSACIRDGKDRLYLPQWDDACVLVPKHHQRLVLQQFTKPFQQEVWIFVVVYIVVRFFYRFDRWRLPLLVVVLIEFWFTESYEVKVIQYMTTMRYAPNPKTMAELIARRERLIVGEAEERYLKPYSGIDTEVVITAKERFIGYRALVYFCRTAEALVNSPHNYNPETNDRLTILLKERLGSYPSSYGCSESHPSRAAFERLVRYVFENGVWRKIHDQFKTYEEQFQPLVAPGEYLVEFGDLMPLWIACGIGWAVAFGIFVVEKKIVKPRGEVIVFR